MTAYLWFVTVTDGETLRTIHPPALSPDDRASIEAGLRGHLFPGAKDASTRPILGPGDHPAPVSSNADKRVIAISSGYTGDSCDTCGAFAIKRTGKCTTCESCGATGGCG